MRPVLALALSACAARPAPMTIGNDATHDGGPVELVIRPSQPVVPYPVDARLAVSGAEQACAHDASEALQRGRDAYIAHAAHVADGHGPCSGILEPRFARFAHVIDREERARTAAVDPLAARAWTTLAALTARPARRRIALRNAAEARWRAAGDVRDPRVWLAVAEAFERALAAGDAGARAGRDAARANAAALDAAPDLDVSGPQMR